MESLLGIGEMARASGLPVTALRFYDGAGVLRPAVVDPRTGYRRYRRSQVRQARLVARLRRIGMPLADVRGLLAGASPGPVLDAHLRRLEDGLADARRELSAVRALLDPGDPMPLTLPAPAFAAAFDAVRYAVGADPERPVLGCVLVERDGETVRLVATDRYRLAVTTVPAPSPAAAATAGAAGAGTAAGAGVAAAGAAAGDGAAAGPGESFSVAVPVGLLDGIRPALDAGEVTLATSGTRVTVTAGDRHVSGVRPDAGFPDWRAIGRVEAPRRVPLDVPAFRTALAAAPAEKRVREQDGLPYETVVLTLADDGSLRIAGDEGLQVAVNRDFLLDALGTGDQLVLELDSPITPLALRVPAGDSYALLMPVRL